MQHIQEVQNIYKLLPLDAKKSALKYLRMMAAMTPAKPAELRLVINIKSR